MGAIASASGAARFLWQVPGSGLARTERAVTLTFDDGPDPRHTPEVLEVLAAHGVAATFFVVGRHAELRPDLVTAVADAGHEVGGHTWDHTPLLDLRGVEFERQIDDLHAYLESLTGRAVRYVRAPLGRYDPETLRRLRARGLAAVQWSVDPRDWSRPGVDAIVSAVLDALTPGAIVLLHDGRGDRSQTVQALPRILEGIGERGYRLVPL
jgi:peptidoglycan/xylan/chitin deacetylase (PgdA/CDA1 family)